MTQLEAEARARKFLVASLTFNVIQAEGSYRRESAKFELIPGDKDGYWVVVKSPDIDVRSRLFYVTVSFNVEDYALETRVKEEELTEEFWEKVQKKAQNT